MSTYTGPFWYVKFGYQACRALALTEKANGCKVEKNRPGDAVQATRELGADVVGAGMSGVSRAFLPVYFYEFMS
jgi:hypothetical protein